MPRTRPATISIPPRDLTQEASDVPVLPNLTVQQFRRPPRSALKMIQMINKNKPRTH